MTKLQTDIHFNVLDFRAKHALNELDPINCKTLLIKLNTITLYRPLSMDFSGMCLKKDMFTFILVNSDHSRGRQHFTIAHELYHLFYQEDFKPHLCNPGFATGADINEKKADAFAADLLMPEMGIISRIPALELDQKSISVSTVLKLENYFSVSHHALVTRLKSLGLINSAQFEYFSHLKIKTTARDYGFGISLYEKGNENVVLGDYGVKAKELFSENKISQSHYYELMDAIGIDPTSEIHE